MDNSFIYIEADYSLKIPQRLEAKENIERLLRFVKLSLREAKGGVRQGKFFSASLDPDSSSLFSFPHPSSARWQVYS
jgi:hypothetical protein